jgi:hypothetical protein
MSNELGAEGGEGLWHAWKSVAENFHGVQLGITVVGLIIPSSASWFFAGCHDFEECLKLTLPLTLAIAITVASVRMKALAKLSHPVYGYVALAGVAMAVAAFVSQVLQVERALDWQKILGEAFRSAPNVTIIVIAPLALLNGYFHLYQGGPFLLSLVCGAIVGWQLGAPRSKAPNRSSPSANAVANQARGKE